MAKCFIIQPFDKGAFDKRCDDVFIPAIKGANLEPYRVDRDPAVSIPIESIENGIKESQACLADVTQDNPNVWFEVGFAIAIMKPVVFVCSVERKSAFPFDIQHRNIIVYKSESLSDFEQLKSNIVTRLNAVIQTQKSLGAVASLSPTQKTEGLAPHEVAVLVILMENRLAPGTSTSVNRIREQMDYKGFTAVAVALALDSLARKRMIEYSSETDEFNNTFSVCFLTDAGLGWIRNNQRELVLRSERKRQAVEITDKDIPF